MDQTTATLLLTMSFSADKEEYVAPLSAREYHLLCESLLNTRIPSISGLQGLNISRLTTYAGMSEPQALRIYSLLQRELQLGYYLEELALQNIQPLTADQAAFPDWIGQTLRRETPPFLYACGSLSLLKQPVVAIMGISGIRTGDEMRRMLTELTRRLTALGYAVATGGEPGVSRVVHDALLECGGWLLCIPAANMRAVTEEPTVKALLAQDRALVLGTEHPLTQFTIPRAAARNRILFALSSAAYICNTDNKRAEADALSKRYCEAIYAWTGCEANAELIARGAAARDDFLSPSPEESARHWKRRDCVQISMFE